MVHHLTATRSRFPANIGIAVQLREDLAWSCLAGRHQEGLVAVIARMPVPRQHRSGQGDLFAVPKDPELRTSRDDFAATQNAYTPAADSAGIVRKDLRRVNGDVVPNSSGPRCQNSLHVLLDEKSERLPLFGVGLATTM